MKNFDDLIVQLSKLSTEKPNPNTANIDTLNAEQIVAKINEEDQIVASVVQKAQKEIAQTAELFANTIKNKGRVFYIGAGTSGRLGVLDASECPPTFGADPKQIIGLISGGYDTLVLSKEGVEDDIIAAVFDLKNQNLTNNDLVIGIAASRRTPYTLAGLEYGQSIGCNTALIICNEPDEEFKSNSVISDLSVLISLPVGSEVITGSTRMKSGTAQKMTLNMISTTAMVLLGKTYGNLMVDLQSKSDKLAARSRKILMELFKIEYSEADKLLSESDGSVKIAIVIKKFGCTKIEALEKLKLADGFIAKIK